MDTFNRLLQNSVELITTEELQKILDKPNPKAYIGFEPSGTVHLGWLICSKKIRDFLSSGFSFTILLADWHAFINDKLGGDIEKIRLCGKYMEDCFEAMGVQKDKVSYVYASDYVGDPKYWELVLKTSKATSVKRVKRAMDIMGRSEDEAEKDLSKLFYPAMQVSDIFYLDIDVAYGGMDQRHAHMLARDVAKKIGRKSPVALHTPLLTGLQAGGRMNPLENKMSKSKPDSMLSIHDTPDVVKKKLSKAYCPEKQVHDNPVLELCKYVIFPELQNQSFVIQRPEKYGGNLEFMSYAEIEQEFLKGLHPLDLKNATAKYINLILKPIHDYFSSHSENFDKLRELGILSIS